MLLEFIILIISIIFFPTLIIIDAFKISIKKTAVICVLVSIIFTISYIAYNHYYNEKLSEQLVINKKIMSEHLEFNIIQDSTLFTDKNSKLLLSEYKQPLYPTDYHEEATLHVSNLYQSTVTENFYWHMYSVVNGRVINERIQTENQESIKRLLLEKDKPLYLTIFGEPQPY